ncbi:bifunctional adenosylcobinamide kinase/adenosylcobinamide-phosphate guanylyltransferase [Sneathiella sp. P13V-1]|uniref:bifunctional adenosylcobinamide kinase/adenosylcobinamide-phosphate guanylyltransferase n=1 Tax=Sneathiella sp. P13V-1 TaxID=2697366 RepID=UPI00187B9FC7|nr:bifunctional adenosylcobinamide kinase/adenosylcobinamide-phosphate guanylyltransferase [Sneathiella sp. P13V-1]MBE7638146.1 bifunctional adenosylcobinamide kinase/adenosylcobinamide-phosphate guanylyltransferase [Sneathiella sp. P13V-1]
MSNKITLVLGGARSGKSRFAEKQAHVSGKERLYLATSQIFDEEMKNRVDKHKSDRGSGWITIEEPLDISDVLKKEAAPDRVILLDCLTLWVTNLMMAEQDFKLAFNELVQTLPTLNGEVILVSNEVGQGIIPDNKMAREFRDLAGWLHQDIAAIATEVYFVTAGLPQRLK